MSVNVRFKIGQKKGITANYNVSNEEPIKTIFRINAPSSAFSSITGSPYDNANLKDALDAKADKSELDADVEIINQTINENYNTLDSKIDDVQSDLSGDISTLETAIQNEATTRAENDTLLQGDINTLRNDLTTEINNRATADTTLQGNINTIQTTINGYGNIVTHNVSEFATAAQGQKADTALQPNDNISELNNDAGYITSASLPTVNNSSIVFQKNGTGFDTITLNQANNDTINITVPTQTSELTNNSGFITNAVNNLTNYYLKSETYTKLEVQQLIASIPQFSVEVVQSLPATGERMVLYLVPKDGEAPDVYDEYIWVEDEEEFELIGSTAVDLSDYVTNSDLATALSDYALSSDIPTDNSELTNGAGYITGINQADVLDALGFTPYNASNPDGYITSADLPTNYVTTDTVQDITAKKTFVGDKAINFKQKTTSDKLGFTLFNNTGSELAAFEFRPSTIGSSALFNLNLSKTSANYVGFRYHGTNAVNIAAPKVATAGNYYIPINVTNGTLTVTANNVGTLDISTLLPDVSNFVTNTSLATTLADYVTNSALTTTLEDYALTADIPTKTSDLTNDSNFATVSQIPTNNNQLTNGAGYITNSALSGYAKTADLATVATSGSYNDLTDKPYIPSGVVVDQTFDGTSANAQSGVAIQGTLNRYVTTDTAQSITASKNYKGSSISVSFNSGASISCNSGCGVHDITDFYFRGQNTYWHYPRSVVNNANGIEIRKQGSTTRTDFTIDGNKIYDGPTGLIPDARLSTNIARTSDIPTATSDLTNDSGYITGITSSDVTTALGYTPQTQLISGTNIKTINNTSLLGSGNIDTSEIFVAEYGTTSYADVQAAINSGKIVYCDYNGIQCTYIQTIKNSIPYIAQFRYITGYTTYTINVFSNDNWEVRSTVHAKEDLSNVTSISSTSAVQTALDGKVSKSGDTMSGGLTAPTMFIETTFDKGTIPSTETWTSLSFIGTNDSTAWQDKRLGLVELTSYATGDSRIALHCYQNATSSTSSSALILNMSSSGVASCTFPNTTCVDGQWMNVYQEAIGSTATSIASNNQIEVTFTSLPAKTCEVMFSLSQSTNYNLAVSSSLLTSTTNRTLTGTGCVSVIMPVSSDKKIRIRNLGSGTASVNFVRMCGYRVIGTNVNK